jgi:hypothetical protein
MVNFLFPDFFGQFGFFLKLNATELPTGSASAWTSIFKKSTHESGIMENVLVKYFGPQKKKKKNYFEGYDFLETIKTRYVL